MTGVFICVSAIELVVVHLRVPWEAIAKVRARRGRVGARATSWSRTAC